MLAIEVDGEFLDLAEARVRLKLVSQVFSRDFIAQGYSYPFSLPWTPTNARLLNHIDRITNVASAAPVVGRLWLGGLPWRPCELVFRSFKAGIYDVDLRTPEDQLILDLKGQTLQDLDYGGSYSMDPGLLPSKADFDNLFHAHTGDIDATDFIFAPVRNTRRFGGRNGAYLNFDPDDPVYTGFNLPDPYVNYYNAEQPEDWFYYNTDPDMGVFFHEYTPFFYLARICESMVEELGYTFQSDVMQEDEVRRQVIVSNMHIGLFVDTQGGIVSNPANDGYTSFEAKDALPNMTLYSFWVKLMRRYCAVASVRNGVFRFMSINSVLNSTDALDLTEYAAREYEYSIQEQDGYALSLLTEPLEKREEEPPLTREALLATVDAFADLAALTPVVGDIAFVSNENAYYQYSLSTSGDDWAFISNNLYPLKSGEEELKLDVGVALTRMYRGEDGANNDRSWLVPWFDQGMSDTTADWHALGDNKCTELRLLYYRGLQPDSEAETYPLLTNGTQDYAGDTIAGATHTERISGTGGIYETWYSQWVTVLTQNRVVERKVRMPLHELLSFDFTRKVRIDGINYLVRTIDVELTTQGMGLATLDLVKV